LKHKPDPFGLQTTAIKYNSTGETNTSDNNEGKPPLSPRSRNGFCATFCCGKQDDDSDMKAEKRKGKKVDNLKLNKTDPVRVSININSPRPGLANTGTAPWKDDQLLPPQRENKKGKKCIVLDLDETLVHSSFKPVTECDFVIPVEIEDQVHQVYVSKRPHVDEYMKRCGDLFEVVVFTASLAKYADPVLDLLDIHKVVDWRLFRESCSPFKGSYVKDMCRMGRDITQIMIVDNSPHSYAFNPESAIPCESWFSDRSDRELLDMIPFLEQLADPAVTDIREKLKELQISGLDALKREYAIRPEEENQEDSQSYTETGSEGTGSEEVSGSEETVSASGSEVR